MNMIFNASAGTGKTWQVTELYCALVLGTDSEHLPPGRPPVPSEKILLMTFTDNAAAELRTRVSEKMIAAEDENDLARSVLRKLPASNISTIHAFCTGLLRKHALELGLSPMFQTLEDEEREALLDKVLKAELFQALEKDSDFREFCAGISILNGDYSLINTIRELLEKAAARGIDLSNAETLLPQPERTVGRAEFQNIYDRLAAVDSNRGLPAKAAGVFQTLEKILSDFPRVGKIRELPRFTGKEMKPISDALAELKERFLTEMLYAENIGWFQAFSRCLANCARAFAEAKRAHDCVDFGDQLLMARNFLKNKSFGAPPFEWIIVDEVQDTSRVQCDVIEALWTRATHLVVCGDKKQSIYAWRSADPDVMPDLEKWMRDRGGCTQINLKTSYRSKDRVIEAVNELFGKIYDSYDALEPRGILADEKPCVEFLAADDEEQGSDEEMAAVAHRIQLLVAGGEAWCPKFGYNKEAENFLSGEPVGYGDILILLKRSTHQTALEKALRDAGVPYTSGGKGKALFEQQEVRDLLLFLQVITQPKNDLALVGFLRSPFANLPDDEIVELSWNGRTFDHEILRKQFMESDAPAAEMLLRYREQIGTKLPSQLVREVVRETAFDANLAGQPGGVQKLANFKKALDWLRAAERGGQVLIGDVVRRFEKAIKTPPRSGAAEALLPEPNQKSVTIMTVHGAKGLTKRVCFVPDISFGDPTDKGFAVFGENSLEIKRTGLAGDMVKSPGWDRAKEVDKTVRKKESDNVFYVAMTRARDLVVISGAGTRRVGGWLKRAEGFLSSASANLLCCRKFSDIPGMEAPSKRETQNPESEVNLQPLKILKGIERKPVTSLVEHMKPHTSNLTPAEDRRALGTLGHLVLEELAKNNWTGDISELLQRFGSSEYEGLEQQLETAREVLVRETAGAEVLFAEHPFVLKRDHLILDGIIDLLVQQSSRVWKIFDYKFSNELPDVALSTYAPQLAVYKEAVEKLNPGAEVSAALVLIDEKTEVYPCEL